MYASIEVDQSGNTIMKPNKSKSPSKFEAEQINNKDKQEKKNETGEKVEEFLAASGRRIGQLFDSLLTRSTRTLETVKRSELGASAKQMACDAYGKMSSGELASSLAAAKYSLAKSLRSTQPDIQQEAQLAFQSVESSNTLANYQQLDEGERAAFQRASTEQLIAKSGGPSGRALSTELKSKQAEKEDTGLYPADVPYIKQCKFINKNYGQQFLYEDTCIPKLDNDYRLKLDEDD